MNFLGFFYVLSRENLSYGLIVVKIASRHTTRLNTQLKSPPSPFFPLYQNVYSERQSAATRGC